MRLNLPVVLLLGFSVPAFAQSPEAPQTAHQGPGDWANSDLTELDLVPEGMPNPLTPESIATKYRLPSRIQPPDFKPPTGLKYSDGPMKVEVGTNVTTNKSAPTIIPQIPDPNVLGGAAGGAGEVKGQVRYAEGQWELYGTQRLGVVQADGSRPALRDSTTFGSLYKLPDWMAGGKIGASLELAPANEQRTRIEYRQSFGPAEGFVAAERTFVPDRPDIKTPAALRGGVTRKF